MGEFETGHDALQNSANNSVINDLKEYIQPMLWASRTVIPNRADASRNFPLLVRYGPIITSASIVHSVGRFKKQLSLRHCIEAATELVRAMRTEKNKGNIL